MTRYSLLISMAILVLAISLSLTFPVNPSLGQGPPNSHAFKGKIVNGIGRPVRDGANMAAWIDGNPVAKGKAQNGQYNLVITQPPGSSFSGKTIEFTVGKYDIVQTAQWEPGGSNVLDLKGEVEPSTIDRARGAIAGFIDPSRPGSQNTQPQDLQQDLRRLEQKINSEKEQMIAQVEAGFQQIIDSAQSNADQEKESAKRDYERELQNIETSSAQSSEALMYQQELEETQRQYTDAQRRNAGRQHLDELERRIIRVRGNLERAKSQTSGDKVRRTSNAKMEYDRRVSQADRELREQLSRMNQEMSREIGNIEREFGQQLRAQREEAERRRSETQRMEMEKQSDEQRFTLEQERMKRQMEMDRERDEQRFQQEELRMKREMEMQEARMKQEMEMDEKRMRMQGDRMGGTGQDMIPGEPIKKRGFLMNPKPGTQAQGFNTAFDPTMLAVIGIVITVLTTGVTLFKGN